MLQCFYNCASLGRYWLVYLGMIEVEAECDLREDGHHGHEDDQCLEAEHLVALLKPRSVYSMLPKQSSDLHTKSNTQKAILQQFEYLNTK